MPQSSTKPLTAREWTVAMSISWAWRGSNKNEGGGPVGFAISVPAFTGPSRLPVGLQLVGRYRRDADFLRAAKSVARALDVETVAPANL